METMWRAAEAVSGPAGGLVWRYASPEEGKLPKRG